MAEYKTRREMFMDLSDSIRKEAKCLKREDLTPDDVNKFAEGLQQIVYALMLMTSLENEEGEWVPESDKTTRYIRNKPS